MSTSTDSTVKTTRRICRREIDPDGDGHLLEAGELHVIGDRGTSVFQREARTTETSNETSSTQEKEQL